MNRLPTNSINLRSLWQIVAGLSLLTIACGTVQAQSIKAGDLAPFEVVYVVGNNVIKAGTARLILSNDGDIWNYSLQTRPRGVFKLAGKGRISETSQFRTVEADGLLSLQPLVYKFRQDKERRRAVDAVYDWEQKTISHSYRGSSAIENFSTPTLDRLTVTLLMMNALRNDFESAVLPVFDTGRVKQVEFTNEGFETLDTRVGDIETIRVSNRSATGGSRETVTWFAPSLDYLPVKIEHKKRGDLVVRLSLLKLESRITNIQLGQALPVEEEGLEPDNEAWERETTDNQ